MIRSISSNIWYYGSLLFLITLFFYVIDVDEPEPDPIIVKQVVKEFTYEEMITNNLKTSQDILWMSMAIYFEARNQPTVGKIMVGFVILNRVKDSRFPDSVSDVIFDEKQFSFLWDQKHNLIPSNKKIWHECQSIALDIILGSTKDISDGATFYHSGNQPSWAKEKTFICKVGDHYFYSWEQK